MPPLIVIGYAPERIRYTKTVIALCRHLHAQLLIQERCVYTRFKQQGTIVSRNAVLCIAIHVDKRVRMQPYTIGNRLILV